MPERMDPQTDTNTPDDQPRWRRPALLVAGVSFLTLGMFVNAERLGFRGPEWAGVEEAPPPESQAELAGGSGQRHKGEEGQMGKPSSKSKPGLYSMKGPRDAVPQKARGFDPAAASGSLAAPYQSLGVGGGQRSDERYAELVQNRFIATADDPKSTFSIDVDTASYANVRRFLLADGMLPPPEAVRTEELINYFDYDYAQPTGDAPFSLMTEVGPCPWNAEHRLVHVGIQGKIIEPEDSPRRNLVFLLDVSGSMSDPDKLPLVKDGLAALTDQLGPSDLVSIVVYAGAAGVVLPPTPGSDKATILGAMDRLQAGGSTNGGEGIEAAYRLAEQNFVEGGVNRVLLATDGDFNVGVASHYALIELVEKKRESGVFLSVLAVGTGNLNDRTMEQLADKGNGNYSYLDGMFEARKVLVAEAGGTLVTIAKDVKIQVEFDPDQVAEHRLVGYENRILGHDEFDDDTKDAGEIGAGHSVTAIYEIVPVEQADHDPLMQLNLRYKQPDGDRSSKISVEVSDSGKPLASTSDDYRFAAAVAAFAERLRVGEGPSYASILELAEGSLGADAQCYRHQFLELVERAARLSGEWVNSPDSRCTPKPTIRRASDLVHVVMLEKPADEREDREDWQAFVLEVLRLLPPFLALPMFVAALRRPRRKR